MAVNRLCQFARKVGENNTKNCYILKLDIKRFFDSIDHNILISLIEKKIKDENAIWLIEMIIKSFSVLPNKGLPLGNITSQLFANIYLNELDRFIKHELKEKYYIRYCDDFIILKSDKGYLEEFIASVGFFLGEKLKLSLHPDKIGIRKYHQGIDFLGYVSFPKHRILRTKTRKRMIRKIERKNKELRQGMIPKEFFSQTLQSYLGMLKHCNSFGIRSKILKISNYAN